MLRGRTADWVPTGEVRKTSMTSRVTQLMIFWSAAVNLGMLAGVGMFLERGYSIVDVTPVLFFSLMNLYIWVPIAALAAKERRIAKKKAAATIAAAAVALRTVVPTRSITARVGDLDHIPAQRPMIEGRHAVIDVVALTDVAVATG